MSAESITVSDMTVAEYAAYMEWMVPRYAADGAKATGMPLDEALVYARKQLAALLPEGHESTNHHFKTVRNASGEPVGILWFATLLDESPAHVFGYDIHVDEDRRGQGLGTAVLRWWKAEGRRLGAQELRLHVFGDNAAAVRLYERLGFVVTDETGGGRHMTLSL